jgi:hypothetical protein
MPGNPADLIGPGDSPSAPVSQGQEGQPRSAPPPPSAALSWAGSSLISAIWANGLSHSGVFHRGEQPPPSRRDPDTRTFSYGNMASRSEVFEGGRGEADRRSAGSDPLAQHCCIAGAQGLALTRPHMSPDAG